METNPLDELIEESIRLELNVADLYKTISEALPEEKDFWWQLHVEEKSHAALIRAARDSFAKRGKFPRDLIADSIEDLKRSNAKVEMLTGKFKVTPPTRLVACEVAVELENEAGETHYTTFMEKDASNAVENVFQQLNRGDKDHERRIRAHRQSIGVNP